MAEENEIVPSLEARIGAQIRACRKAKNLTQAQLAELSSVDNMTISRLENGVRQPTVDHLLKLATVLGVSASRLLGENQTPVSNAAIALSDVMEQLTPEQRQFIFDLILLYKQSHLRVDR